MIPWGAWLVPLGAWLAFFAASFGMMACLSVILRAQWGEREVLSFPLLRLPLELAADVDLNHRPFGRFFSNPLMWIGFFIAVTMQMTRGLHLYFPDVPAFPLELDTRPLLLEAPWKFVGALPIRVFPIAVGVAFFLSGEVGFSLWAFFLGFKVQMMLAGTLGFAPATMPQVVGTGGPVFLNAQESGAFFALGALCLWAGRRHFAHVARRALRLVPAAASEANEALSFPVAFWGFIGCFALVVVWGVAAGLSVGLSLLLWTSYLLIAVVLSRVVAESGLLFVSHTWMPLGTFAGLLGMGPGTLLSPHNGLGTAAFLEASTIQDYRACLMPSFVQSFKLAYDEGIPGRRLFALLSAVIAVGMVVGCAMNVRLGYERGGLSLQGWLREWGPRIAGANAAQLSHQVASPDAGAWLWTLVGMGVVWAVMALRARSGWFALHPMGYVMANSYPMQVLWFSILLGWTAKTLVSRFGGTDAVRKVGPLFLGFALGDVTMMLFWIAVDGFFGRTGHQLMPG